MSVRVLISFFCDDRPGVVEELSAVVESSGGNWLDSQLSRLGGRFAGVLQVQVPKAHRDALAEALLSLERAGITASITDAGDIDTQQTDLRCIRVLGPDRQGIVHELTKALREADFNVRSLVTAVETAPMSGELLFRATAQIEVEDPSKLAGLELELDKLAEQMTLEIDVLEDID
ncbi:MAG: ACT domain-containing protein [Pseudomonadota bacterium]